jgi:hypothetical protein
MTKTIGLTLLTFAIASPAIGVNHSDCLPQGDTPTCAQDCNIWVTNVLGGEFMGKAKRGGTDDSGKDCKCLCLYNK